MENEQSNHVYQPIDNLNLHFYGGVVCFFARHQCFDLSFEVSNSFFHRFLHGGLEQPHGGTAGRQSHSGWLPRADEFPLMSCAQPSLNHPDMLQPVDQPVQRLAHDRRHGNGGDRQQGGRQDRSTQRRTQLRGLHVLIRTGLGAQLRQSQQGHIDARQGIQPRRGIVPFFSFLHTLLRPVAASGLDNRNSASGVVQWRGVLRPSAWSILSKGQK